MNRTVFLHFRSIMPDVPNPDAAVFLGGGTRPNKRFRTLCDLAGIEPKTCVDTGEQHPWVIKDLRKTCATYYDEHVPESSSKFWDIQWLGSRIVITPIAHRWRLERS